MKYTMSLMLLMVSIGLSQEVKETKIDSVAITAAMETELNLIKEADRQIKQWQINRDKYIHAYNAIAKMLVPKVGSVVEEDEKKE